MAWTKYEAIDSIFWITVTLQQDRSVNLSRMFPPTGNLLRKLPSCGKLLWRRAGRQQHGNYEARTQTARVLKEDNSLKGTVWEKMASTQSRRR